jgi:hypothetical protein
MSLLHKKLSEILPRQAEEIKDFLKDNSEKLSARLILNRFTAVFAG